MVLEPGHEGPRPGRRQERVVGGDGRQPRIGRRPRPRRVRDDRRRVPPLRRAGGARADHRRADGGAGHRRRHRARGRRAGRCGPPSSPSRCRRTSRRTSGPRTSSCRRATPTRRSRCGRAPPRRTSPTPRSPDSRRRSSTSAAWSGCCRRSRRCSPRSTTTGRSPTGCTTASSTRRWRCRPGCSGWSAPTSARPGSCSRWTPSPGSRMPSSSPRRTGWGRPWSRAR